VAVGYRYRKARCRRAAPDRDECPGHRAGGTRFAEAGDDKLIRIRDADTLAVFANSAPTTAPSPPSPGTPTPHPRHRFGPIASSACGTCETGRLIENSTSACANRPALHFSADRPPPRVRHPGEKTLIWELE
jgi:hypothetical protein